MNKKPVRRIKKCSACKNKKRLSSFRKYSGRSSDGLRPICKPCQRKYEKKWRSASKEKLRKMRFARSDKAKSYARIHRSKFRAEYLVDSIRRRCAKSGIDFNLADHIDEIRRRINAAKCEVTCYPLDLSPLEKKSEMRPNAPSIDRVNPALGYVIENIRVVCWAVNAAMLNWGEDRFIPIATAWVKHYKKRSSTSPPNLSA